MEPPSAAGEQMGAKKNLNIQFCSNLRDRPRKFPIHQRTLHCIRVQRPVTATSVEFCLLCCQPELFP